MTTKLKCPKVNELAWVSHADGRLSTSFTKRLRLQVMMGEVNGAQRFMAGVAEAATNQLVIAAFYPRNMQDGKDLAYQLGVMVLDDFPDQ